MEHQWDYIRELEAIAKFSQPLYQDHFVRAYGWFEDRNSVFIDMEYFPLGDLSRSMRTQGPFPEAIASRIVGQLLKGIQLMHEEGFAHRDLKSSNILVASRSPSWLVKIADFSISKQGVEGGTDLRTMVMGTLGYMAPGAMGFFPNANPSGAAYSVSMDIWAIGAIAAELVLNRPACCDVADLAGYIHGARSLNFSLNDGAELSHACQEFVRGLLTPNHGKRVTAKVALTHPWLLSVEAPVNEDEDCLFVDDEMSAVVPPTAVTPASPPSLAWSTLQAAGAAILLPTYRGPRFDMILLLPQFRDMFLDGPFKRLRQSGRHPVRRYSILVRPLGSHISSGHQVWYSNAGLKNMGKRYLGLVRVEVINRQVCQGLMWTNRSNKLEPRMQGVFSNRSVLPGALNGYESSPLKVALNYLQSAVSRPITILAPCTRRKHSDKPSALDFMLLTQ
ncbi:kinase-like domain-containing protein [Xylariales sp. PMI_506]|nr:kinase-like domain-containing protein [Xylariales sp. PMI_506]